MSAHQVASTTTPIRQTTDRSTDYDSDDSQLKKKTNIARLEWLGKTYEMIGKENALHILRMSQSVRTLMELNQLEKLIDHVGNFVNNYTPEQFKYGILREQSKSDVVAGMSLAMTMNHDLNRLQTLACFGIKELQENLFYQKYDFPNSCTATSLFPEHFLTKTEAESCNYEIKTYDMWVKSWHGYQLFLQFLLGPSYRDIIAAIINDIQQNNIGQLFDIEYLLILTVTMRALLYEYSSSTTAFTVHDSTIHVPADMTANDWQIVIKKL